MADVAEALKSTLAWASVRDVSLNGTHSNESWCANNDLLKIIEVKLPTGFKFGRG